MVGVIITSLSASPALAASNTLREAGLGAGSAVCSLVYGPFKIAYATVGTILSGAAWLFTGGNGETAGRIYHSSLRGDYVVTPEHLTGKRNLEVVGRHPRYDYTYEDPDEGF